MNQEINLIREINKEMLPILYEEMPVDSLTKTFFKFQFGMWELNHHINKTMYCKIHGHIWKTIDGQEFCPRCFTIIDNGNLEINRMVN